MCIYIYIYIYTSTTTTNNNNKDNNDTTTTTTTTNDNNNNNESGSDLKAASDSLYGRVGSPFSDPPNLLGRCFWKSAVSLTVSQLSYV